METKITKDSLPKDYTIALALVDAIPVLGFFGFGIIVFMLTLHPLVLIGSIIATVGGFVKVLWKLFVVLTKKNIWPMFVQMRITMPLGIVLVLTGLIIAMSKSYGFVNGIGIIFSSLFQLPAVIFFTLAVVFMISMIASSAILGSYSKKANWFEEVFNSLSQLCFFLTALFIFIS